MAAQQTDPGSILNRTRELLRVRRDHPCAEVDITWLDLAEGVVAYRRGDLAVVLNTAPTAQRVELLGDVLYGSQPGAGAVDDTLLLPPDSAAIIGIT